MDEVDFVTGYVYGLFASDEEITLWNCRYIGKTVQTLQDRLTRHVYDAKRGIDYYSCRWIRKVLDRGAAIEIHAIETHTAPEKKSLDIIIKQRETAWIVSARKNDWRLTNVTDGGGGLAGFTFSEESRQKMSDTRKERQIKHSPETISRIVALRKANGTYVPWNKGKTGVYSDETRAKISQTLKARVVPEDENQRSRDGRRAHIEQDRLAEQ